MPPVTLTGNQRPARARADRSRDAAAPEGDPLVPRMLLGRRIRELRERSGLSRREAGHVLGGSVSRITRLELGKSSSDPADIDRLLARYGADAAERTTLLALAEQTGARPWWHDDGDIVPAWARPYFSAEQAARLVRTFEPRFVPGLLQTEDYARTLIRDARPAWEVERRVGLRMRRQRVLRRRPRPLNLWIVLDERALWRPVGGPATMRAQIRHIMELCGRPNVTVQIAPPAVCRRVTGDGPLTLVRFPQQGLPDMVYLERAGDARYPKRRADVERHWHVFNTLVTEADPPEMTPRVLAGVLTTY